MCLLVGSREGVVSALYVPGNILMLIILFTWEHATQLFLKGQANYKNRNQTWSNFQLILQDIQVSTFSGHHYIVDKWNCNLCN